MEVSIIVPVYNTEKFLPRCLDSLINQTLKDIEIICINDGSPDNSLEILKEYQSKDNRIKIISTENGGLSAARNIGLKNASGEYVGFVDSDDWVDLDFYEKLINAIKKYDADIAVTGFLRNSGFRSVQKLKFDKEYVTSDTNEKFLLCDIPEYSYVWNKIYNRKRLLETGIVFETGIVYEDVVYTPQVLYSLKTLVTVPETFYHYWRHSKSTVMQKSGQAVKDRTYAQSKALDFFREHNIDISKQQVVTKRYRLFGITIFKTQTKNKKTKHILFNIIKW